MKKMNSKKGFTLIELLIVIAIIAVLAVAFLPTILGAPAKGRDTARIASLQKMQKVLVSGNLGGIGYPDATKSGVVATALASYVADFGGVVPADPKTAWNYYYEGKPTVGGNKYEFGLYAMMETSAANAICTATFTSPKISKIVVASIGAAGSTYATDTTSAATDACYVVLTQ